MLYVCSMLTSCFPEPCGQSCGDVVAEGMTIPHTEVWRARPQDISKISKLSTAIPVSMHGFCVHNSP